MGILVMGHRGAAGLEPENTMRSFHKAVDLGVDWIEMDVHLTRDGHLAVIHDERVDRTTNGRGLVREMTLAEVKRLDAGKGERIPILEEVLDAFRREKPRMQVELKAEGTAKAVVRLLAQIGLAEQVRLTCGNLTRLREVKQLNPRVETGAIFGKPPADCCEQTKAVGAVALGIEFHSMNAGWVEKARALGLQITPWNPDSPEDLKAMIALNPYRICTNKPDILLQLLGRQR
jgi:glycerophosphoryl diester phosphodiesterase